MYWDLNSGSSTYNRLVYKNPGGDYEHLIDYDTYNYMFTTDYNYDQIAGKGGAIFFHQFSPCRADFLHEKQICPALFLF